MWLVRAEINVCIAQWIKRLARKLKVVSSNLIGGNIYLLFFVDFLFDTNIN